MTSNSCQGLVSRLFIKNEDDNSNDDRNLTLKLLSNPLIGSEGMGSISTLLQGSFLSKLYLSRCNIGDDGFEHLINWCTPSKNVGLQTLDISHNGITAKGLDLFSNRLLVAEGEDKGCSLPKLTELNLSGNKFDSNSVSLLATAIGRDHETDTNNDRRLAITNLDLSDTSCGIDGAKAIMSQQQQQQLGGKSSLTTLSLFNNSLGLDDGFVEIASNCLIGGHPTIKSLDLGGNHANEESCVQLLKAIITAPTSSSSSNFTNQLELLILGGNEGGPNLEAMIREVQAVYPKLDIARDKPKTSQQQPDMMRMATPQRLANE